MKKNFIYISSSVAALIMIFLFQNCSPSQFKSAFGNSPIEDSGDNGHGYGGINPIDPPDSNMPPPVGQQPPSSPTPAAIADYISSAPSGHVCPGGDLIASHFRRQYDGSYALFKHRCQWLNPLVVISADEISEDASDPLMLYYDGLTFKLVKP